MNNVKEGAPAPSAEGLLFEAPAHQPTIKEMLGELSFREWIVSVRNGLNQPKSSGEYKYAMQQVKRLWAPVCGVVLPLFLLGILMLTPEQTVSDRDAIPVTIEAPKANDVLKDDPKTKEPEPPPEPQPPDDTNISPDPGAFSSTPGPAGPAGPSTGPSTPFSPQPAAFDSVAMVKSPIMMRGVYASRAPGARGTLTGKGGGGGGGGDALTEAAVLRALRWLKKNQQPDGSWSAQRIAMTGLAVLTFLAHGEKPGSSPEFGETVKRALEFLVSNLGSDGRFIGMDGNGYAHPIATYALCEAYGMTLNPNVKAAAEKAIAPILSGQHPSGGWDYNMKQTERDDTSYMGWCAQAIKAGKLAKIDAAGLDKAIKQAVRGFKKNAGPEGGFGYTGPGQQGLTSVGTLCMQLLGAANEAEVRKSLALMESWQPSFDKSGPQGGALQYYCYYATQAKFHAGGKVWENWNKAMKALYIGLQKIERNAIKDDKGRDQDIGWWENGDSHSDRPVMDTCLAALQLMVYYRYLPTTNKDAVKAEEEVGAVPTDTGDIKVNIGNL